MRIGVFTVLFQDLTFEAALDKALAAGVTAVEIGSGGYPGNHHCPVDELLESEGKRVQYMEAIHSRGLVLSALSCHYEPLHPDQAIAEDADEIFRKSIRLAQMLEVPVVNVLSGLPAGSATDTQPNWVTCPWPNHFTETLDYQWNQVGIPYWRTAAEFAVQHGVKIAVEMRVVQLWVAISIPSTFSGTASIQWLQSANLGMPSSMCMEKMSLSIRTTCW